MPDCFEGYARFAMRMWYLVQVELNPPQLLVILELDAAVKLQIVQRAGHAAIRQPHERLEFDRRTLRTSNGFRYPEIIKYVEERAAEIACAAPVRFKCQEGLAEIAGRIAMRAPRS